LMPLKGILMTIFLYMITCDPTGKKYIGYSKDFERRVKGHFKDALNGSQSHPKFYNAIRKYGKEKFDWRIVDNVSSLVQAKQREIELIAEHNSYVNGLNSTLGGDGCGRGKAHPMSGLTGELHPKSKQWKGGKIMNEIKKHKQLRKNILKQLNERLEVEKQKTKFLVKQKKKLLTVLKHQEKNEKMEIEKFEKRIEARAKAQARRRMAREKKFAERIKKKIEKIERG